MVGTVGTGVTITRSRGSGWLDRLAVLPLPAWRVGLELFFAGWLVDILQATLVFLVIAIAERPDPATLVTTWLLALAALAFSGAIGLGIAALTDHPGEAMLYLSVVLAPLLFLSGLFTGIPAEGIRFWVAQVLPFSYLDEGFQLLLGEPSLRRPDGIPDRRSGLLCHLGGRNRGAGKSCAGPERIARAHPDCCCGEPSAGSLPSSGYATGQLARAMALSSVVQDRGD